jgi:hypothetical protein
MEFKRNGRKRWRPAVLAMYACRKSSKTLRKKSGPTEREENVVEKNINGCKCMCAFLVSLSTSTK